MTLKPCPKCGGTNITYLGCVGRLKCRKCGYKGGFCKTRSQAQEAWNDRTEEDKKE